MKEHKNSAAFFANKECRFYPCHEMDEEINCLFCYCPLYHLDCPGNYEITEKDGRKIRNCAGCTYPHIADNYGEIIRLLKQSL